MKRFHVVFLLTMMIVPVTSEVALCLDYKISTHEISLDFLIDASHASVTLPNGESHLFIASQSVYHWYSDGSKWTHERIFELPDSFAVDQLNCAQSSGHMYVFIKTQSEEGPLFIQIEGSTGDWQVSYPDWITSADRMLSFHTDPQGRIYCVWARQFRADHYFLIFKCLEGGVWGDPIPFAESNGKVYIGSIGDTVHCFYYADGFIQHARIIDQHPTIERMFNYPPFFDVAAVYNPGGVIHALIRGYEPVLGTWTDSTGWIFETVPELVSATSAALIENASGDLRIIASIADETFMFSRDGSDWLPTPITSAGMIQDVTLLMDGSIRFLLSGYSYSYWTISGENWNRDFVFASVNCADYAFSFSEPGNPYIAILNPDAVIRIHDPKGACEITTTPFEPMPTGDKGSIAIENMDRFHSLTWSANGASGLKYHLVANDTIESEMITNESVRSALIGLDEELNPHTVWEIDDAIVGSWRTEGFWQGMVFFTYNSLTVTKSMIRDAKGGLYLAVLEDLSQSPDMIHFFHPDRNHWYQESLELGKEATNMSFSLGAASVLIPEMLIPVDYDRIQLVYPGADGWIQFEDLIPSPNILLAPQLCVDAFRNPVACSVPDGQGDMLVLWRSTTGWSSTELNLGTMKNYCSAKARMCLNDALGCCAVAQTADGRFHIIEMQKQAPWFELGMQHPFVHSYSTLELDYFVQNGPDAMQASGVILMEVHVGDMSIFYNVPDFSPTSDGLKPFNIDLAPFEFLTDNILSLKVPSSDAPSINLVFWGAVLDSQLNELKMDIARLDWGFCS